MPGAGTIIHLLFVLVQLISGILANGLIAMVSGTDWIRQRKAAPLDLLLSCLAISRIFLQFLISWGQLAVLLLLSHPLFTSNFEIILFVNELSLWFATCLGVFYCAKIATLPHPLFLWLKTRISRLVPWLILGCLLYTTITCSIYSKYLRAFCREYLINLFSKNATQIRQMNATLLSFFFLGLTLPMLIFLVFVLLLIFSLGRHTQKMRTISAGTREPSRRAHLSAMLSILSFVVLYFSHYLLAILLFIQAFQSGTVLFWFCLLMVGAYPSVHSTILILGNPKLKQKAKTFLLHCKCCQ